ncbi:MAG: winged helix-turn-helix domain-containing protein [Candidatus Eremiobacteraeota bacterium]|nr:winged helix-turn-helix domain-containing protein [Candidatus Eremiobacteraeota bacterium]MBV8354683.1 winged helix-turn-helix domain-containing protein [Candidatus Eremiobacteraeota bacterium]
MSTTAVRVAFGPFVYDRSERTLWQDGAPVPLTPKAAEALALLLTEPGALVAKEHLREALWPEGFVEDGNLTQTIYLLRRVLEPGGDGRRFVETVPRRGYRFAAETRLVETPKPNGRVHHEPARRRPRFSFGLAAALFVIILGGLVLSAAQSRIRLYPGLSVDASREYALGRYWWNQRTLEGTDKSIAYFADVVRLAPQSPLGYAGLADAYLMIANHDLLGPRPPYYALAENYARMALARDPHSGEALTTLAFVELDRDHNRDRAERDFQTAMSLNPLHAPAHEFFGIMLLERGKVEEAAAELRRAAELDPVSVPILMWYGVTQYYGHHFEQARVTFRQTLDLDTDNEGALYYLTLTDQQLGKTDESLGLIARQKALERKARDPQKYASTDALAALVELDRGAARVAVLPDLRPSAKRMVDTSLYAALCLRLGRRDDAIAWLRLGIDKELKKMGWATGPLLPYDPELNALADDPRFQKLAS